MAAFWLSFTSRFIISTTSRARFESKLAVGSSANTMRELDSGLALHFLQVLHYKRPIAPPI